MITLDEFRLIVRDVLGRSLNDSQGECIEHNDERNLHIVAGPGSGKTTVLVLRALRRVFVDDALPESILITTFTTKAAKELRTRWLDWGSQIVLHLQTRDDFETPLQRIDLNRCRIDTLDSVAQQVLAEHKLPGEIAPEVIEDATANLVLKRRAFSEVYRTHKAVLDPLLARYSFDGQEPKNQGEALRSVKSLCERLFHDRVDLDRYAATGQAQRHIVSIARAYRAHLTQAGLLDFASLEDLFLQRLQDGTLDPWLQTISTLLIDEYQDTNPLQEEIYFQIIRRSNCQAAVVGDDDQAMYRFRGGSVELFTQFAIRCNRATGRNTRRVDMVTNYRSSREIVTFYNSHIRGDAGFANARIVPSKPEVIAHRGDLDFPVLGMFRQSPDELAQAVATWLDDIIVTRRFAFTHGNRQHELRLTAENALGDCVMLGHTVDEAKYEGYGKNTAKTLFPGFLRVEMEQRGHHIFNPRGRSLRTVPNVQKLLGLMLLALDPNGRISAQDALFITDEATHYIDSWRREGQAILDTNPVSRSGSRLTNFISRWQRASLGTTPFDEPDWPVLELVFKLITWLPEFQNDPEHQVWLEAVTRTFTSATVGSPYQMQIYSRDENDLRVRSRASLIRDGLVPIAEDEIAVDEDIMPSVPRNRLQIMTIHQAKGLEFPLVIVDLASSFKTANWKQAFRRFPREASNVAILEDDIEPHLDSPLRAGRSALDRSFDDLARLYYVAFSRPQSVMLLVGCEQCLKYGTGRDLTGAIPHIGMGWLRNGTWPWRQPRPARGGVPVRVEPPFHLV